MSQGTPAQGPSLSLDISGLGVELHGLTRELGRHASADWSSFVSARSSSPFLHAEVLLRENSAPHEVFDAKSMTVDVEADRARFALGSGSAEISRSGAMLVRLAAGGTAGQFYTLANLLCAGFAWKLPDRGGVMLHAAGIVIDERAFLLVGQGGSGKTTWSALAKTAGASVLSDDMVFVDGAEPRLEVLSTPFRDDYPVSIGPGRWPLAAILLAEHGNRPRLEEVPALLAQARLVANLPFVVDGVPRDPRPLEVVQHLIERVPVRKLVFARDARFVDALRGFPDARA